MNRASSFVLLGAIVAVLVPLGALQELPSDHPPVLPPGHPPMQPAPAAPDVPADPADIASPAAVVRAFYETVSGPAGAERDWSRFKSLFAPEAQLVTARPGTPNETPLKLTPDEFIAGNRTYFERGGYWEREIHSRVDSFGRIAQVFSTYESRRGRIDSAPYSRGINAIQLMHMQDRWWIVSVVWDRERGGEERIPSEYLPPQE